MKVKFIYITENSMNLADKIQEFMSSDSFDMGLDYNGEVISFSTFKKDAKDYFENSDFLVFIMATGIVVRTIAQLLKDKFTDPGVIVMDEKGRNVISLLSGHIGGANEMTEKISSFLGGNPVITTATDVNNLGAFDMIVKKIDGTVDNLRDNSLKINSKLLKKEVVNIFIQEDYLDYLKDFINGFTLLESMKKLKDKLGYKLNEKTKDNSLTSGDEIIVVSDSIKMYEEYKDKCIYIVPRKNILGVGCRKDTDIFDFEEIVLEFLKENDIIIDSLAKIGSIELKKEEKCILSFSEKYKLKTHFLSIEDISKVDYKYEKSEFVKKRVGVYSVAEPVCDILSNGNIISQRLAKNGITVSIGREK